MPPRCAVYARPPRVPADCHATCAARSSTERACAPESIAVNHGQLGGDAASQDRLRNLVVALRANLGTVLRVSQNVHGLLAWSINAFYLAFSAYAGGMPPSYAASCAEMALGLGWAADVAANLAAAVEATDGLAEAVSVAGAATK